MLNLVGGVICWGDVMMKRCSVSEKVGELDVWSGDVHRVGGWG